MATVSGLFDRAVGSDPTRPVLTYYDDRTGERTELSGASLRNWLAKTANLLVDGEGLAPGERALVLLPPHWQTAGVLLGCWAAGLEVCTEAGVPARVAFVAATGPAGAEADERYLLGLHPLGLPLPEVPAGYLDYSAEVRGYGDRFAPVGGVPAGQEKLCERAARRAAGFGIAGRDRVLVDAAAYPDPVDWLLAPLAAGASIVLCGHLDPARLPARRAAERVTLVLPAEPVPPR
ncbi:MAG: TIGR03089 family protein [Micromonosporaceae bacterium]|nr:TIGR03089 family protein [Micromonosporaceae bacterium]